MKIALGALLFPLLVFPLLLLSLSMGNASSEPPAPEANCTTAALPLAQVGPAPARTGTAPTTKKVTPVAADDVIPQLMKLRFSSVFPLITREQAENIVAIARVARELKVPKYGLQIAIATAIQESKLRNLAFGDRDSVGLFQQRPSTGWGSTTQIMDPTLATKAFFGRAEHTSNPGLLDIPGWQKMQLTVAAQAVQRSGLPNAYAQWTAGAGAIVEVVGGDLPATVGLGLGGCPPPLTFCATSSWTASATDCGKVTWPVPAALVSADRRNWGGTGSNWGSWHTGTDFSVACGTPVLAAHAGTVVIDTSAAWSGRWLVKVSQGPGALTTWYAHMQQVTVSRGQHVTAGQPIGQVGTEGNSTGCHLHFEVHEKNGSIYGPDNVNASDWLKANAGK